MKFTALLIFLFVANILSANDADYSRARIWFDNKNANQLAVLGIDLSEGDYRKGVWFTSDFDQFELKRIREAGFRIEILIEDVSAFYRERNNSQEKFSSQSSTCGESAPYYPVPSNFHLGNMGGFYYDSELQDILDSMSLLYPNLITVKQPIDSTLSIEGRPIYFLKISDNPNSDEAEPEVLYTGLHHAREPISITQLIYYMWYLLENYQTDPLVKALVDNTEMFFVPCLNPDGYMFNETTTPFGGGMWRKNRRDNLDGQFGVDLNRNYGYNWGYDSIGSSDNSMAGNYRGTAPFSEPETQAIRNFCESRDFKLALNYHSFGNLFIYPWGYEANLYTPDSLEFIMYSSAMTKYSDYHAGLGIQTVQYVVNGSSDDWMYGEQITKPKIFSITPEVGNDFDGFWPQDTRIIPLSQENMYTNLTLAKLAGRYGTVDHNENNFASQLSHNFGFTFNHLGLDTTGSFTISLQPVSNNIASTGTPVVLSNLTSLQQVTDSIMINLNPGILPGEEFTFLVLVDNGLYVEADTVTRVYGSPVIVLYDDGSTLNNWSTNVWNTTTEDYVTPPSSITDSPMNTYPSNDFNELTLSSPVSLTGALYAQLSFYAKWETENDFDYIQFSASADGVNWTPLCGKYTNPGSFSQVLNEPLYDGTQSSWVNEEINLNDFLGQDIQLKFSLISDSFQEFDGFYFDDMTVEIIPDNVGIDDTRNSLYLSPPFPNPVTVNSFISYTNIPAGSSFSIFNAIGQKVWTEPVNGSNGKIVLSVSKLAKGIYSYFVSTPDGQRSKALKLVVN